jgi:hypothetical protein
VCLLGLHALEVKLFIISYQGFLLEPVRHTRDHHLIAQ